MERLNSKITFTAVVKHPETDSRIDGTQIIMNFVNDIEIVSSYENLTSTAKIVIPRKLTFNGKNIASGISSLFKRGDKVRIECGYFPNLRLIFQGFITKISLNDPILITCDDQMFILKNYNVTYPPTKDIKTITQGKTGKKLKKPKVVSSKITLSQLLDHIIPNEIEYKTLSSMNDSISIGSSASFFGSPTKPDVNIGSFRINDRPASEALQVLKDQYGIYSYFVTDTKTEESTLYVGFPSNAADTNTITYYFENNIIDDTKLEYQRLEDVRAQVTGVSMDLNTNKKTTITVGDGDGVKKTFYAQNLDEKELKEFANNKLVTFKYEGYKGAFTTFGEDYARHGDIAYVISYIYPEKNGHYLIKSITRTFGMGGYRQSIEIGSRIGST